MDKYEVHLCKGCIALMDEHYPYTVPREHLKIITVPIAECDNTDLENYNKKLSERNAVPDDEDKDIDEKGFVFIDDNGNPYRCAMLGGQPWLFYWHNNHKSWVTLREVSQSEIQNFPRNLSQEQQNMYFREEQ